MRARTYTVEGVTRTIPQWAAALGLTPQAIHMRLAKGWPPERAMTAKTPPHKVRHHGRGASMGSGPLPAAMSADDRELVCALKAERERLRAEVRALSDIELARKFEVSVTTIQRL